MNVEVLVQGKDGGEALLTDGADECLGAVGQSAMFHHLKIKIRTGKEESFFACLKTNSIE